MKQLSPTEQTIYELVKMKDSIEGINNSYTFGLPTSSQNKENVPQLEVTEISSGRILLSTSSSSQNVQNDWNVIDGMIEETIEEITNEEASSTLPISHKRKSVPQDSRGKLTTSELIEKEVETQKNLCSKVSELIEFVKEDNKEMKGMMKRMCRSLEKMNDHKSKKFKEMERHNAVMENYKKMEVESKLEKNKKLIELEEMKLAVMKRNNV